MMIILAIVSIAHIIIAAIVIDWFYLRFVKGKK